MLYLALNVVVVFSKFGSEHSRLDRAWVQELKQRIKDERTRYNGTLNSVAWVKTCICKGKSTKIAHAALHYINSSFP